MDTGLQWGFTLHETGSWRYIPAHEDCHPAIYVVYPTDTDKDGYHKITADKVYMISVHGRGSKVAVATLPKADERDN